MSESISDSSQNSKTNTDQSSESHIALHPIIEHENLHINNPTEYSSSKINSIHSNYKVLSLYREIVS